MWQGLPVPGAALRKGVGTHGRRDTRAISTVRYARVSISGLRNQYGRPVNTLVWLYNAVRGRRGGLKPKLPARTVQSRGGHRGGNHEAHHAGHSAAAIFFPGHPHMALHRQCGRQLQRPLSGEKRLSTTEARGIRQDRPGPCGEVQAAPRSIPALK